MSPYVTIAAGGLYLLAVVLLPPRVRPLLIALGVAGAVALSFLAQRGVCPCGG